MKRWLAGLLAVLLVLAAVPTLASARTEEVPTVTFEDFYVEGGYVFTAYLSTQNRITMTSGKWLSADGKTAASLTGGMAFASYPNGWKFGEDGGVYWRQIHSEKEGFQSGWGIVMDPALIPVEDFTVEIVAAYHGVEDDAGNRYYSSKSQYTWGIGGESFCVGNVRAYGWSAMNNDSTTDTLGHRWFFTPLTYGNHNTTFTGKVGVNMAEEHAFAMAGEDQPVNYTVKYDRAADKKSFTLSQDIGFTNVKTSNIALSKINGTGTLTQIPDTNDPSSVENTTQTGMYLKFLLGIPAHVYSVRLYDRVLTAAEQKQNHFADLAGYYGLNLAATLTMTEEEKEQLYDAFSAYGYRGGDSVKAELQAFVDGAALSDYDALYDKTNMTVLLTAFAGGTTLDMQAGVWENTASGSDARLMGPRWQKQNGGVGYEMTYAEWKADQSQGSNYIDLSSNNPSGDYVVEILQTVEGLTNPDGSRYETANASGVYGGAYACYEIGYTKLTGFVSLAKDAGCSMVLRCSYLKSGYWSSDNGGYWLDGSSASFANVSQHLPVTLTMTGTKGKFSRSNSTLYTSTSASASPTNKTHSLSNVDGLNLTLSVNGAQKYAVNTVTTGTVAINPEVCLKEGMLFWSKSYYERFLQTTYATGGEFRLVRNLPGTVYSVKVYTSAPSQAQKAQNHFADLCGYYGLDVRGLEELSAADRTELYSAFASHSILATNVDHTEERAALQAIISAKTASILHDRLSHGDVNGNGMLEIADVTLLLQYLADWQVTLPYPDRADVNHDGTVTLVDAQLLLQYLAGYADVTL